MERQLSPTPADLVDDARVTFRSLDVAFDRAMEGWRARSGPVEVLFSGGVDSSLIAWELRDRPAVRLRTIGLPASADLATAEGAARLLNLPWSGVRISEPEVRATAASLGPELERLTSVVRPVAVAVALAIEHAESNTILCGQGADELFLGYAHFRGLSPVAAGARLDADLARLRGTVWPLTERLAGRWGKTIGAPYLDPEFVAIALAIPIELRLPQPGPKALFRTWALHRGLPAVLAERPKRALQYGSGVARALR